VPIGGDASAGGAAALEASTTRSAPVGGAQRPGPAGGKGSVVLVESRTARMRRAGAIRGGSSPGQEVTADYAGCVLTAQIH
jgi:hypothetical protein